MPTAAPLKPRSIVYLMPGLGLDSAIFQPLELFAQEVHYLSWLEPKRREPLEDYAKQLAACIKHQNEANAPLVLIGHSFGGVLMQEVSKLIPAQYIILISSVKKAKEKGAGMNFWLKVFPVHELGLKGLILGTFGLWGKSHGYDSPAAQAAFRQAVKKLSPRYFRWSIRRIAAWKPANITTPITHFHGTKDKTFPARNIQAPVEWVEGGDHVMVFNKAAELSERINTCLKQL